MAKDKFFEISSKGGSTTVQRYGKEYMKEIQSRGGRNGKGKRKPRKDKTIENALLGKKV